MCLSLASQLILHPCNRPPERRQDGRRVLGLDVPGLARIARLPEATEVLDPLQMLPALLLLVLRRVRRRACPQVDPD